MSDKNFIKFLGTAGARIVVSRQARASGGLWYSLDGSDFIVDPGPGSLVRCTSSRPRLDPAKLKGIILTHKHLDHSGDINIMIEAMTNGGFDKRGKLFLPSDALGEDGVVYKYLQGFVDEIVILKEEGEYSLETITFSTPLRHIHSVETYGLNIRYSGGTISHVADTRFFPELAKYYRGDVLILNVVRYEPDGAVKRDIDHLKFADAEKIISEAKPEVAVLTHFGMTMLRAKPWELAAQLQQSLGVKVIAARDGMKLDLDEI
jgi:ribonuclease BN (tRNA processing enzyme)